MIFGTGIDMIETERVAEKIAKENGFREYLFTPDEITYCESKTFKFEHYAARFAAKEALLKALGTGFAGGVTLNEVEVIHADSGKPEFNFIRETALLIASKNFKQIHLTISHLKHIACAMVVIEK